MTERSEMQKTYDVAPEYAAVRARVYARVRGLVERITYRAGYEIRVDTTRGMKYPYVQVWHMRPDSGSGVWEWGSGGKAYVTEFASDSEIIQLILGLCKAYEEHEVREFFRVDGAQVYGPHIDVEALLTVADRLDLRAPHEA